MRQPFFLMLRICWHAFLKLLITNITNQLNHEKDLFNFIINYCGHLQ
jgi:hypothetical protein